MDCSVCSGYGLPVRIVFWSRGAALLILAAWFGASVFLTFGAGPAFFSPTMLELVPRETAGRVAQLVLSRYFLLIEACGLLALGCWVVEFLATDALERPSLRRRGVLLALLFGLALAGGFGLQPHLKALNQTRYAKDSTESLRESARRQFGAWHGVSQAMNLVVLAGVGVALWGAAGPGRGSNSR